MSGSVNKVILVGYLGQDPEVRNFPNGGKVVNLRLATSDSWVDRNTGERKERTEWHSIAIFNEGLQAIAQDFLKKGSLIHVDGKLETRKWQDTSGQDRYSTEIVLRAFQGDLTMLGPKQSSSQQQGNHGGMDSGYGGGDGDYGGRPYGQTSQNSQSNQQGPQGGSQGNSGYRGGRHMGGQGGRQQAYAPCAL